MENYNKANGSEEKMGYFWWIACLIALNSEDSVLVVGVLGVMSKKIKKHTLNFEAKSW